MPIWKSESATHIRQRGAAGVALSLSFLGLMFAGYVADSPSAANLALTMVALAAFVGIYVGAFLSGRATRDRNVALASLGVMLVLAVAIVAFSDADAWLPLFVYVAALGGRTVPDLAEH